MFVRKLNGDKAAVRYVQTWLFSIALDAVRKLIGDQLGSEAKHRVECFKED